MKSAKSWERFQSTPVSFSGVMIQLSLSPGHGMIDCNPFGNKQPGTSSTLKPAAYYFILVRTGRCHDVCP
jgi:hypothetical protein